MTRRREYRLYRQKASRLRRIARALLVLLGFVLFYIAVSELLLTSVAVGSVSMQPTFTIGDRLLVSPLSYGATIPFTGRKIRALSPPDRGDLVLLRPPYYSTTPLRRLLSPFVEFFTLQRVSLEISSGIETEDRALIRRVIGIPGDAVRVDGYEAFVLAPGEESYVSEFELSDAAYLISRDSLPDGWDTSLPFAANVEALVLGENQYFVMSDYRNMTNDSRYWGAIGPDSFIGKPILRYWPFSSFGVSR